MPSTVDKIRRALDKKFGISEDEMRPLAATYANEVSRVNDRLDEAVDLLKKGLRSEAIQSINRTPNAMQAAADLEFPEVDEWYEILQFMGVEIPPTLNEDAVSQVNDAIVDSMPLDALMRRQRQLAIAKAPLGMRLRVLRQIKRKDEANPVWIEDIESWEKERIREIDLELDKAIEDEDIRSVCSLHQELTAVKWEVAPPARLIEQASFVAEGHYQMESEKELAQLADRLQLAFEKADEPAARKLLGKWKARKKELQRPVSPELDIRVKPVAAWILDLDKKTENAKRSAVAVSNLKTAMDNKASLDDIRSAHQQALQFGEPLPDDINTRYHKLLSADKNKKKLKVGVIGGAAAAVVVGILIGVITWLNSGKKDKALQSSLAQFRTLIADGNYEQANSFYERLQSLQPEVAQDPQIQNLYITVEKELNEEKDRAEKFRAYLDQADDEDPSKIDKGMLERARAKAKDEIELAEVEKVMRRLRAYQNASQEDLTQDALEQLDQYRSEFTSIQNRPSTDENLKNLRDFYARLNKFASLQSDAQPIFNEQYQKLKQETSAAITDLELQIGYSSDYERDVNKLAKARSFEEYAAAVRAMSGESTVLGDAKELLASSEDESSWQRTVEINRWLANLGASVAGGVTPAEARNLIKEQKAIEDSVSVNPAAAKLGVMRDRLTEAAERDLKLDQVIDRLKGNRFSSLVELRSTDPTKGTTELRYYTAGNYLEQNPDRLTAAGSVGIEVVNTVLGARRVRSFRGKRSIVDEPMSTMKLLLQQLEEDRTDFLRSWESQFIKLIIDVEKQEDLDGLIKENIIADLVDDAISGSQEFRDSTKALRQDLELRETTRDKWFQARAPDTKLDGDLWKIMMTELKAIHDERDKRWNPLADLASRRMEWIGFLIRTSDGNIECIPRGEAQTSDGDLFITTDNSKTDKTDIRRIGRYVNGVAKLDPSRSNNIPGRPVFFFAD